MQERLVNPGNRYISYKNLASECSFSFGYCTHVAYNLTWSWINSSAMQSSVTNNPHSFFARFIWSPNLDRPYKLDSAIIFVLFGIEKYRLKFWQCFTIYRSLHLSMSGQWRSLMSGSVERRMKNCEPYSLTGYSAWEQNVTRGCQLVDVWRSEIREWWWAPCCYTRLT